MNEDFFMADNFTRTASMNYNDIRFDSLGRNLIITDDYNDVTTTSISDIESRLNDLEAQSVRMMNKLIALQINDRFKNNRGLRRTLKIYDEYIYEILK